jgi:hypothetical protein
MPGSAFGFEHPPGPFPISPLGSLAITGLLYPKCMGLRLANFSAKASMPQNLPSCASYGRNGVCSSTARPSGCRSKNSTRARAHCSTTAAAVDCASAEEFPAGVWEAHA